MKTLAFVYDLDGTILDNEGLYSRAFAHVLKKVGVDVEKDFAHKRGIGVADNWKMFKDKYDWSDKHSIPKLTKMTQDYYLENIEDVKIMDGFEEFALDALDNGVLAAMATSNEWFIADQIIEKLGLNRFFGTATTGDELMHKKPDPQIFFITFEKLGVDASDVVIFEDSPAGIEAAIHAGAKSVIAVKPFDKTEKWIKKADKIIDSFEEIVVSEFL